MSYGVAIQRPKRWDNPFSPDMDEANVDRLMGLDMFREMDTSKFTPALSLRDIVRNDTRIRRYKRGDILIRTGDYGTTAFLIISGHVRVVLPPKTLPDSMLGHAVLPKKGFFEALSQLWRNPRVPEARNLARYTGRGGTGTRTTEDDQTLTFLLDVPSILAEYQTIQRGPGSLFGEIAALARSARSTTIFAEDDVEAVEIRRQGIRDIRQRVETFRVTVDDLYRAHSLRTSIREASLFQHLDDAVIDKIAEEVLFETYGDFDWHISYKRHVQTPARERLAQEPVIVHEGDYPDGLLIIAAGTARVTRHINHGDLTVHYISAGDLFGLEEIAQRWREGAENAIPLQHTLRAVGYADILRVPTSVVEAYVLPSLPTSLMPATFERRHRKSPVSTERRVVAKIQKKAPAIDTDVLEILVENRYINGTATMLIDLDRCVRCDACVEACANGHNNNPRFIRHGPIFDHYMVANACMHCNDPVCMIGCPTGAIHRNSQSGEIVINDDTCIGCATCAGNCPYDNIRMVEIRDDRGYFIRDQDSNLPIVKATKCNLCIDQLGGPACQRACPHDALVRVDMRDHPTLARWFNR